MFRGKKICNQLKAVRRQIADENGIPYEQHECTHEGDCRGTCPRCEAEVRYLEQALTRKLLMGKAATVAGLSLSLAACGSKGEVKLNTESPLEVNREENSVASEEMMDKDNTTKVEGIEEDIDEPGEVETGLELPTVGEFVVEDMTQADSVDTSEYAIEEGDVDVFVLIEEYASFPGGEEALDDYLEKNIVYPKLAKEQRISGTVVVKFVVEKDGSITNARVLREIGGGCGAEALRVVKNMPKWKPGKQSGRRVRSEYTLPIFFELD